MLYEFKLEAKLGAILEACPLGSPPWQTWRDSPKTESAPFATHRLPSVLETFGLCQFSTFARRSERFEMRSWRSPLGLAAKRRCAAPNLRRWLKEIAQKHRHTAAAMYPIAAAIRRVCSKLLVALVHQNRLKNSTAPVAKRWCVSFSIYDT